MKHSDLIGPIITKHPRPKMHVLGLPETVLSVFLQRFIDVVPTHQSNQSKSMNCHVIHLFLGNHACSISLQPATINIDNVPWF